MTLTLTGKKSTHWEVAACGLSLHSHHVLFSLYVTGSGLLQGGPLKFGKLGASVLRLSREFIEGEKKHKFLNCCVFASMGLSHKQQAHFPKF